MAKSLGNCEITIDEPKNVVGKKEYSASDLPSSAFTFNMSGTLTRSGGGSGTVTWSATAEINLPLVITPNPKVVMYDSAGVTIDYTSKRGTTTVSSTWSGSGITFNPTTGSSTKASVTPPGSYTITATSEGESANAILKVVKVELNSLKFTSDHGILRNNNSTWEDTGTVYSEPEWIKSPVTNNPITHTKNNKVAIELSIKVEPAGIAYSISGNGGVSGLNFSADNLTSTGNSQAIAITSTEKLADKVNIIEKSISWKITIENTELSIGDTGSHKIYVTYGTPSGSVVTEKRINCVTSACKGLANEAIIVQKLWTDVVGPGSYSLGAPYPNPEWKILGGTSGECIAIAKLFEMAIKMIGITPGSGSVVFLYVDPNGSSHENSDSSNFATRDCRIGNNGHTSSIGATHADENQYEKLAFVDNSDGGNNWEACYKYRHNSSSSWVWYAAGTGGRYYSSVQNCMNDIVKYTRWRYCNSSFGSLGTCTDPGPSPEKTW